MIGRKFGREADKVARGNFLAEGTLELTMQGPSRGRAYGEFFLLS